MITFIKHRDINCEFDRTEISMTSNAEVLPDLLEDLAGFLVACGYSPEVVNKYLGEEE